MLEFTKKLIYIVHTSWATLSLFTGILLTQFIVQNRTIVKIYTFVLLLEQSIIQIKTLLKVTSLLPSKLLEIIS